jgi:hypothetical protein
MRLILKIFIFLVLFGLFFYFLRESDFYNSRIILADVGGIPWLYATIGTLFSILSGFTIQKEWENWNNLMDAVSNEVHILKEMWVWSRFLSAPVNQIFHISIKSYLEEMSDNGLYKSEQNIASSKIEESISVMNKTIFDMFKEQPLIAKNAFSFFTKLIDQRNQRIRYSSHHVPKFIKGIMFFATSLMIILSMFVGIKNVWLDFIFTLSVSMLSYVIYLVIDDLDHPLVPGGWHLTASPYKKLLTEINASK